MFLSGYAVSGTLLGLPDVGYLTQTEMADAARRVCAAVPDAMVVVDADTGYGNAAQRAAHRGAVGVGRRRRPVPRGPGLAEAVRPHGRQAGRATPRSGWPSCWPRWTHATHLFVTARTDARAVLGLDEAIERARMAADLGVDAVFVEAPESVEELSAIAAAVPGVTLVANMVETGRTPLLTPDELGELGLRPDRVAVVRPVRHGPSAGRRRTATCQAEGTMRDRLDDLVSFTSSPIWSSSTTHLARDPDAR